MPTTLFTDEQVSAEQQLSELLMQHAGPRSWERTRPLVVAKVAALLRRLPVLEYHPSGSADADLIAARVGRSAFGLSTIFHQAVAVKEVLGEGDAGLANKSARKHGRRAIRAGVTWRLVTDRAEKERLVRHAYAYVMGLELDAHDDIHVDFSSMLSSELWLVAHHEEEPILLAVTAVDGPWAVMRYFGSFGSSRTVGSARYLMTQVLADELAKRGVRYMCDSASPLRLAPGLREFSRMTGFRNVRVKVRRR